MTKYVWMLAMVAAFVFVISATNAPAEEPAKESASGGGNLDWPIDLDPPEGKDDKDPGDTPTVPGGGEPDRDNSGHETGDPLLTGPEDQPPDEPPEEEELAEFEIWGTLIEADEVIFCLDRTGSMNWPYTKPVVDLEGNMVPNATKMQAVVMETKRAITKFSDNIKFNVVFWAHRYGRTPNSGHPISLPGPEGPNHYDPPDSDPDAIIWRPGGCVEAVSANKMAAFQWIDASAVCNGCTPISDGCKAALNVPGAKTVLLLSDGFPNTFQETLYAADQMAWAAYGVDIAANRQYCVNRTKQEIRQANGAKNCTIHTFFILYNSYTDPDLDPLCRKLMQDIAAENHGQYTEIGQ
jgi:hypothetical protein